MKVSRLISLIAGTRHLLLLSFLFLIGLTGGGCTLVRLNNNVQQSLESTILVGTITCTTIARGPIIVAARPLDVQVDALVHYSVLHESGEYELLVPPGSYHVFAFVDSNDNRKVDPGEPVGQYGEPKQVTTQAGGVTHQIDFTLPDASSSGSAFTGLTIAAPTGKKLVSREAGAIIRLDDELFAPEQGVKGFWEPVEFYREVGGNIYFLEKYDPKKIPVLFIHGATGTPAGWQYFVENLDRSRYQPWFFYYPTGARLNSMSYLLFWKLFNLQLKYRFDTVYLTAHSMGGLVARSFIMDYSQFFPYVSLFVSLATPWGGDKMAEYGVRQSPAVIPSWIDMQPQGEFIQSLYRARMPDSINFYMFSGHRGGRNPFQSNNDGTISLTSILDARPQAEARMNYAFDEDHVSIISSKEVLSQYRSILDSQSVVAGQKASSGGYIQADFRFDASMEQAGHWPTLILQPEDSAQRAVVLYLSDRDKGRTLGPIPQGKYRVNMVASSAVTNQKNLRVQISSQEPAMVSFTFSADGVLASYITAPERAADRPVGMPAESYLPEVYKIPITSIKMRHGTAERTIYPTDNASCRYPEILLARKDYYCQGAFSFFGLEAGRHELEIEASGYMAEKRSIEVVPGKVGEYKAIELTRENSQTKEK